MVTSLKSDFFAISLWMLSRERLQIKKRKIAHGNTMALKNNFDFDPRDYLNKPLVFGMRKTCKEKILDRIIEKLPSDNDLFYVEKH